MSMFHELMMRKKEEIMYATIKGTLTENDGVFSGFSASNYLQGSANDKNLILQNYLTNFAFQIKVNLPNSISAEQQIIYIPYRGILSGVTIRTNGKIYWYAMSGTNVITSSTTFSFGTTIWIKGVINNSVAILYSSADGKNWTTEGTVNLDNLEISATYPMRIGVNGGTTIGNIFEGSIDLNNSYIKLGSTKYKLQAVVGYTVVGSPTITDGVVSGFSRANYVHILNFPNTFNSLEIVTKAKKSATGNQPIFALQNGSISQQKFYLYMANLACLFYYRTTNDETKNISISYSVNVDVYYYFRLKISNSKIKLGYSTDGTNWVEEEIADTIAIASSLDFRFGIISSNTWYLDGSIDLNETFIKINNKLWFNGQEG